VIKINTLAKQKTLVNAQTDKSVDALIKTIDNDKRRKDSETVLEIMTKITGQVPKLWGSRIVGFGKYKYSRKNGDEFEWFNVGFAPNKSYLSVYVNYDLNNEAELLEQLGPHKTGKGCLNIKNLADLDIKVLKKLITKSSPTS